MPQSEVEHWVFAYGSLMWDPGFPVVEMVKAQIRGFSRRFCLLSVVHRGTIDMPGLALALDEDAGGCCAGLALRVAPNHWDTTLNQMRERELVTNAYREEIVPLHLAGGRVVDAVTYVTRREHNQYVGALSLEEQARIIAYASGGRGPNYDYLFNTTRHLAEIGLAAPVLEDLARQVGAILQRIQ